ncbi:heme-degrading domain-containing protein [Janthinobacterium sp. GW460P]|uniref:heme-degrading domain-containing protein n=1 Tax=unclassified Janthinobacterium TaxID=2610881 RepID=UPI000A322921|nr:MULTISPECIES: heme-degrading domain-containing protein [unclassified Janthinobacterium]MCC7702673.1 heme-degrading domain-containing protein [Janthinobacterium sp. GW460P]MCC7708181.1 heme-degrading domain-containing protein [Janthinobacterium sp. GW460W]
MDHYADLLHTLAQQEESLQFERFDNDAALAVGLWIVEEVRKRGKAVTVNIMRNGQVLFHHAMTGATADQADWIRRKNNTVQRFCRSSYYMGISYKSRGSTFEDVKYLDDVEYAGHGGAFPLLIRGVGLVGTVTVSGLAQADDHALVVAALQAQLDTQLNR